MSKKLQDDSIPVEDRKPFLADMDELTSLICAPNPRNESLSSIVTEMFAEFPHLTEMSSEKWKEFLEKSVQYKNFKTSDCEQRCETGYALELLELSGLYVASSVACGAVGVLAPLCVAGVTLWYAGAVGGAYMDYNDCLADC